MAEQHTEQRALIIRGVFVFAALLLIYKALDLQVLDTSFRSIAGAAGTGRITEYPSRGMLYDREERLLVVNNPMYDLMVTFTQFEKGRDNFKKEKFCRLLGIDTTYFNEALNKDWKSGQFAKSKPFVFLSKISADQFAAFQESLHEFPGFSVQLRNARGYPHQFAAHVLGYIGEVSKAEVEANKEIYTPGDYIGTTGLEREYEPHLRGQKGVRMVLKDKIGREMGALQEGKSDINAVAGTDLYTTLDLELQAYGESLLQGKTGSIVAIQPKTGEILAMVSSPAYDPGMLTMGQQRGKAFTELLTDSLKPFLDRSVLAQYPPGSLFKPIVALIGLQEGSLKVDRGVSCHGGFFAGAAKTGCHGHPYASDVVTAIQYSCNAYFVTTFLEAIGHGGDAHKGLDRFSEYLYRFGLGKPLGVDLPVEGSGHVPTADYYNRVYKNESRWKAIWIRSLGIGQGEYLMTNLQMANLAAAIANRGYWITPHLVRELRGPDGVRRPAPLSTERHDVGIDDEHFGPVIDGMERVVLAGTARVAQIPGISVCGKTGTAENPHGDDHSIFFAFAPKEDPQIAIAVYVENGTWGSTYAAPIASLMIEKHLNDSIAPGRKYLEERMIKADLIKRAKPRDQEVVALKD